jgi:N6-L-threonylcarbamoyladenine synthase
LSAAGVTLHDLSAVGVTYGPGLVGALLVGVAAAKALAFALGIPLIGVHHLEGHISAALRTYPELEPPFVSLVVSGGHTSLVHVRDYSTYHLLGQTRDDAAGEAYDKVAKLLGYGYPGGPVLDRLAVHGNPDGLRLSRARMKGNELDFSFSGVKTAMLRWSQAREMTEEIAARRELLRRRDRPTIEEWLAVTPQATLDAIAAFQQLVIDELLKRLVVAVEELGAQAVVVAGGVSSNAGLRRAVTRERLGCPVWFTSPSLSTDNAAMIGAAAWPKYERGEFSGYDLRAQAALSLTPERG